MKTMQVNLFVECYLSHQSLTAMHAWTLCVHTQRRIKGQNRGLCVLRFLADCTTARFTVIHKLPQTFTAPEEHLIIHTLMS
jgi:hypothetical protein